LSRRCHIKIVTWYYGILHFIDNHAPFFPCIILYHSEVNFCNYSSYLSNVK
jgi:hypothetical protein